MKATYTVSVDGELAKVITWDGVRLRMKAATARELAEALIAAADYLQSENTFRPIDVEVS